MTAPTLTRPLTPRQQAILDAVWDYWREHRYGPSLRDLMDMTPYKSTSTVAYQLGQLEGLGLLKVGRERGFVIARAIVPIGDRCPCCGGARPGNAIEDLPPDLRVREFPR